MLIYTSSKPRWIDMLGVLSLTLLMLISVSDAQARRDGGRQIDRGARTSINDNRNFNRNFNRNDNINVNRNRNVNRDIDVNVHHDYDNGWRDHPVATAAAVTAAATITAAVVGSIVYGLPAGCAPVVVNGMTFQQCGSAWYQPQYSGTQVTYVVVNPPR